ncbi:DUF5131 family protein [Caloranaerobacter sp. DY30410]|uniref:DUF5131 family protein n=1 Tax=Caloranaerobacter sp. DY30410 TaxID=3238305 RepID=UPI003D08E4AC
MNKTKIEWCDYTWNPVTGCLHGCHYCYARRIAERFRSKNNYTYVDGIKPSYIKEPYPYGFYPTFYPDRLNQPKKLNKPSKIFVVSMGDLFGDWVPIEWIKEVINVVRECEQHTFMFLTKNGKRLKDIDFPDNAWVGVSIGGHGIYDGLCRCNAKVKFISIEPLLEEVKYLPIVDWYIIGAQTGPGAKKPKKEWVQSIIDVCRESNKPVFLKDNLNWHEKIQEFPVK